MTGTVDSDRLVVAHGVARDLYRRQLLRADGPGRYLTERGFGQVVRVDAP
jgi:hypothetical protein